MSTDLTPAVRAQALALSERLARSVDGAGGSGRARAAIALSHVTDARGADDALAALDAALAALAAAPAPATEAPARAISDLRASVLEGARHTPIARLELGPTDPERPSHEMARLEAPLPIAPAIGARLAGDATGRRAKPRAGEHGETLRSLGEELCYDLGALGLLRHGPETAAWSESLPFEERLLATFDALASLARDTPSGPGLDVVGLAVDLALDWPVPDPARVFAAALPLTCGGGAPALVTLLSLAQSLDSPYVTGALVDALALGTHPGLDAFLAARLGDEARPSLLAVWLDAARRRRSVPATALDHLAHPDAGVARAAAASAVHVAPAEAAPVLARFLGTERARSTSAAIAIATLGGAVGVAELRKLVVATARGSEPWDATSRGACRTLALLGDPRDADALLALAHREHEAWPLAGWHGHVSAAALEAALLETPTAEVCAAAARVAVPLDVSPRAPIAVEELVAQVRRVPSGTRVRRGQPWSLRVVLSELTAPHAARADRREGWLEFALARRTPPPFDVDDWVPRQARALAALVAEVEP